MNKVQKKSIKIMSRNTILITEGQNLLLLIQHVSFSVLEAKSSNKNLSDQSDHTLLNDVSLEQIEQTQVCKN